MVKRRLVRNRLVIMVKEPRLGRVKTRLAREIGETNATRFYRTVSAQLIHRLARDPRWHTILAVTPDTAVTSQFWPPSVARVPQGRGDLGIRMIRALSAPPRGPVVVIGSDIPGVRAGHIAQAFRALGSRALVFGPAEDGGFWLIGANHAADLRGIFRSVRWSSAHTLTDTLANLRGRRIGFAAPLRDVDNAEDLRRTAHFCRAT